MPEVYFPVVPKDDGVLLFLVNLLRMLLIETFSPLSLVEPINEEDFLVDMFFVLLNKDYFKALNYL